MNNLGRGRVTLALASLLGFCSVSTHALETIVTGEICSPGNGADAAKVKKTIGYGAAYWFEGTTAHRVVCPVSRGSGSNALRNFEGYIHVQDNSSYINTTCTRLIQTGSTNFVQFSHSVTTTGASATSQKLTFPKVTLTGAESTPWTVVYTCDIPATTSNSNATAISNMYLNNY